MCEACGTKGANVRPDFEGKEAAQSAEAGTADRGYVNRGHKAILLFRETMQRESPTLLGPRPGRQSPDGAFS